MKLGPYSAVMECFAGVFLLILAAIIVFVIYKDNQHNNRKK